MVTADLLNHNIPRLRLSDSIGKAKMLLNDFKLTHLPLVADKQFIGLMSEEDLLDIDEDAAPMENIQDRCQLIYIQDDVPFLDAISYCQQYETNIVPILDKEAAYMGVITASDLLRALGDFTGANETGGVVFLEMERPHYSVSEIARIVEENDCTIYHLNVRPLPNDMISVTLHLNKKEIDRVLAAFERYDYTIVKEYGTGNRKDDTDSNYRNLMKFLDL